MLESLKNDIRKEIESCNNVAILRCVLTMLETHNERFKELISRPYTISEAAKELGVTPQTVRSYIHQGKLKAHKLSPNTKNSKFIIDRQDLINFMDRFDKVVDYEEC